jgi:AsmA protein
VDLADAMKQVSGAAPLSGKTTASLALSGKGIDWAKLRQQLTGAADVALANGALSGADLGGDALAAVSKGLSALGQGKAAQRVSGAGGKTQLRDLAASFGIEDGWMKAKRPLSFSTPAGKVELGGRIGLDQKLDLQGTIAMPRAVLADLAPKAMRLPETLSVPLGLGGTLEAPAVQVRGDEVASKLAGAQAGEAKKAVQQEIEKRAGKSVGDLLHRFGGKR